MNGIAVRVLVVTLGLTCLWACQERSPQPDALVGAWRTHITADSGALVSMPGLQFMTVFNAGGTMTESSNFDGAPPVPPAYGVWRQTGERTFQARYDFWVTKPPAGLDDLVKGGGWGPAGHGTLAETITLSADRRSYTSKLTYTFFDADGKPASGGGTAVGSAVRMGF